jgi:hypothetical protein
MNPSEYILNLFAPSETVAIVLIHSGHSPQNTSNGEASSPACCVGLGSAQRIVTAQTAASAGFQAWLHQANENGTNIYLGQNPLRAGAKGRTKADIARVKHVYLDIDANFQLTLEAVRSARLTPNYAVRTSPDKGQLIWRVEGFDATQAEITMKTLVRMFHGDPAATDISRILRIPGFRNWKYSDGPLVTVECLDERIFHPQDFPCGGGLESMVGAEPRTHTSGGEKRRGDRSVKDFAYACRHLKLGESPDDIAARIAAYRPDKCDPADYGERTVAAAQKAISG